MLDSPYVGLAGGGGGRLDVDLGGGGGGGGELLVDMDVRL